MGFAVAQPAPARDERLKLTEIFLSLQGESSYSGWPTVFVRLTGCPLRCVYCDTAYAFHGGQWKGFDQILDEVAALALGARHVCVTGGEPLAQKNVVELLKRLCDAGYAVSLETSGALDVSAVDTRVMRVVDVKTPDSGEVDRNLWSNFDQLTSHDEVKFVICSRSDYDWSKRVVQEHSLTSRCTVLFSPSHGQVKARELADWIVQDRLAVRFQTQLHKQLWGEEQGR
ncbi:7-carboxy-7-deazaguanine synthase QueE [Hydrocarboniphaga effusa]|jgi:7-carboxy-7-deazaguanine synthase|uniref:7-carboxy-7-deazaguanine synthase QueE n=1 Tax=Hydrocarboniphaga effusa TaxID=243629 RepID=UPI003137AC69